MDNLRLFTFYPINMSLNEEITEQSSESNVREPHHFYTLTVSITATSFILYTENK
jgi:hypothetical protein